MKIWNFLYFMMRIKSFSNSYGKWKIYWILTAIKSTAHCTRNIFSQVVQFDLNLSFAFDLDKTVNIGLWHLSSFLLLPLIQFYLWIQHTLTSGDQEIFQLWNKKNYLFRFFSPVFCKENLFAACKSFCICKSVRL